MSAAKQDSASLPIEQRLQIVYQEARQRDRGFDMGACAEADGIWNRLRWSLGNIASGMAGLPADARERALEEANRRLIDLRDHGVRPPPPSPERSREQKARGYIEELEQRGFCLDVTAAGDVTLAPVSKLHPHERAAIADLRKEIAADLTRRADVWVVA